MFEHVSWPTAAVYNITPDGNTSLTGGADVEHHFSLEGEPNVWMQKAKLKAAVQGYAEQAMQRCSEA